MVKLYLSVVNSVLKLVSFLVIAMMASMAILAFYQVLTRFIFHAPSPWTEEVLRREMIWLISLSISLGFRQGLHICVNTLHSLTGKNTRYFLHSIVVCLSIAFFSVIAWQGWQLSHGVRFQTFSSIELSMFWAYLAIPVGAALSIITLIAYYLELISERREG